MELTPARTRFGGHLAAATGLLLFTACGAAQIPQPQRLRSTVLSPLNATEKARGLGDPVQAADVAWAAGNDRKLALTRLEEALRIRPDDHRAHLRRGLLALSQLDLEGAQTHLLRTVVIAPT
ncbi:MAG: hypothetical protein AAF449_09130, partial [Myxococcota bacterium]